MIDIREEKQFAIISFKEDITSRNIDLLRNVLDEEYLRTNVLKSSDRKKLIIDMGRIQYLNSPAIDRLIRTHKALKRRDVALALYNLNRDVHELIHFVKLQTVIQVCETEKEAVSSPVD